MEAEKQKAEICPDPDGAVNKLIGDLQGIGLRGIALRRSAGDGQGFIAPFAASGSAILIRRIRRSCFRADLSINYL